jgi:hypothetical protein
MVNTRADPATHLAAGNGKALMLTADDLAEIGASR